MIRIAPDIQQADWNASLTDLPCPHVLQSWEWGEFKARYGWRPSRYLWQDDGQPRAAASVLTRRLGLSWSKSTSVRDLPQTSPLVVQSQPFNPDLRGKR
jgi:lipid II:glycine glycyltransferase (peptidoglycan interpeptide bridge formation enzyme)